MGEEDAEAPVTTETATEDKYEGLIWNCAWRFDSITFWIRRILYITYFLLFIATCGTCYQLPNGIFTIFILLTLFLIRMYKARVENDKPKNSCCFSRGCFCFSCSCCCTGIINFFALVCLLIECSLAHNQFLYDETPTKPRRSKGTGRYCPRTDFLDSILPSCDSMFMLPIGILIFDLILNIHFPYWFKGLKRLECWPDCTRCCILFAWKIVTVFYCLSCIFVLGYIVYTVGFYANLPLCLVCLFIVTELTCGCVAISLANEYWLCWYICLLLLSIPGFLITTLIAFLYHFYEHCETALVHWEYFTPQDSKYGTFGYDWSLWLLITFILSCQVVLFCICSGLQKFKFGQDHKLGLKCILAIYALPFLPLICAAACLLALEHEFKKFRCDSKYYAYTHTPTGPPPSIWDHPGVRAGMAAEADRAYRLSINRPQPATAW